MAIAYVGGGWYGGPHYPRLLDLGPPVGFPLKGPPSEAVVPFPSRQDDAFVGSRISLIFSYSGAVARDDGELSVYLNNDPIASVALGRTKGPKSPAKLPFIPALLTTDHLPMFNAPPNGPGAPAPKSPRA